MPDNMPVTREELVERLTPLEADASGGEWHVCRYGDGDSLVIHYADIWRVCFMATPGESSSANRQIKANADLICELRNSLPAIIAALSEHPAGMAAAAKVDGEAARLLEQRLGFLMRLKEGTPKHTDDHPRAKHFRAQRDALDAAIQALRQPFVPEPPSDEWARAIEAAVEKADIELIGAHMVLEGKVANATGALAKTAWRPDRAHIEGMRNTMAEALEYVADARRILNQAPKPDDSTIPVHEGD